MDKAKSLEQLAMRLSHLSDGADDGLNPLLVEIRKALKGGAEAPQIDDLSRRLASALVATGHQPEPTSRNSDRHDLSGLRQLVKSMPVDKAGQERLYALVQKIAAEGSGQSRQRAVVELLDTATAALRGAGSSEKSRSGVRRWLGRRGDPDEAYVSFFVELLRCLVEHIDVLNGNSLRSGPVREALQEPLPPDRAQGLLNDVMAEIEAIDARIRAERSQTTDFLGDLRERLSGFEKVLELLSDGSIETLQRTEALSERVGEDAKAIGDAARTDDIDRMRVVIGTGMTRITERLAEHVLAEREQNETSKARVTELSERLERLEAEADELRGEVRSKTDLALKDALTGVYNRSGYEARSAELFHRWERSGAPLSMVFADCDSFKSINDAFGHSAGDLVLMKVAEVLRSRARANDVICRYGGDEFVVLLPNTPAKGAEVFARAVCDEVGNAGFNDNGTPLDVSISCGITELVEGDTLASAVSRADDAMYQAKNGDADFVCVAANDVTAKHAAAAE